jgi:serine/threonine-protein kinase
MTPKRWQRVKEIFQAALDKPAAERAQFVANACDGDAELRKQVESLLASSERDGSFIDSPAQLPRLIIRTSSQFMKS